MIVASRDHDIAANIEFERLPAADYELVRESVCPLCSMPIHVYAEVTGLLPDEYHGDRRATHSWLVCELYQRINVLQGKER